MTGWCKEAEEEVKAQEKSADEKGRGTSLWKDRATQRKLSSIRRRPHTNTEMDARPNLFHGRPLTDQKVTAAGKPTKSAHPARFSPDDKFSRHRVTIKKR